MTAPPIPPAQPDDHDDPPAPPPSDAGGRVELARDVWVGAHAMQYTFARASGPGGQAVNKLSTAALLRVPMGAIQGLTPPARERLRRLAGQRITREDDLLLRSQQHRSQLDNRRACLQRLRELVQAAVVIPKKRKASKPTRGMIERRLRGKRQHSEKKQRRRRPSGDD